MTDTYDQQPTEPLYSVYTRRNRKIHYGRFISGKQLGELERLLQPGTLQGSDLADFFASISKPVTKTNIRRRLIRKIDCVLGVFLIDYDTNTTKAVHITTGTKRSVLFVGFDTQTTVIDHDRVKAGSETPGRVMSDMIRYDLFPEDALKHAGMQTEDIDTDHCELAKFLKGAGGMLNKIQHRATECADLGADSMLVLVM